MGDLADKSLRWARERGALLLDGKYRLEEPIGEGGMGTVWRATNVTLERAVAVKFVRAQGERAIERFLREARIAASIHSPYVVDVLEFGVSPNGDPVLVMELLEGEALDERLDRDGISAFEAVRIMAQVLVGLDAVHRAGIVHRDLKPANIFLSNDGAGETFARLIDFGVSHSVDPSSNLRRGKHGTDERVIVGTPAYIAPEQAEGRKDVDARADVYSIGVMLYELLAGQLPFDDEHPGKTLYKVMDGAHRPLSSHRPDLPELSAVIERAMARDRDERPQSARELRDLLLATAELAPEVTGGSPVRRLSLQSGASSGDITRPQPSQDAIATLAPPPPAAPSRARLVAALLVVVLAATALGVWLHVQRAAEPPAHPGPVVAAPAELAPAPAPVAEATPSPAPAPATVDERPPTEPVLRVRRATGRARPATTSPESAVGAEAAPTTEAPAPTGGLHRELDF
jgi:serine/threonine-protein kinase